MKKFASTGLIACALLFGVASCNQQSGAVEEAQQANEEKFEGAEMEDQKINQSDFMTKAASSSMFELESSKLAQQKAQNKSVKDFANMLVSDHQKTNSELKSLASQKNITLPDSMSQEHKDKMQELRNKTGAEFDQSYIDMMVDAHDSDVTMFEDASNNLEDPDVKAFASQALPTLRQHQERVKQIDESLSNNNTTAQQ